jgi:pimeloyl-ACP methyl ester carboxylesterase
MDANRLIEEWRQQGRILEVEGANTVLWRMGQGETVICIHGVPTSGFLYRKLLPELSCACRKLNPAILVMQSAQDWATKNVPGAIDGARDRRIFLQG